MKKLALSPLKTPFEHCFEAVLANCAHWLGRDYQLMYLDEWGFDYGDWQQAGSFGKSLNSYRNKVQPLKKYHGVLFHEQQGGFDDMMAYVDEILPHKPVVVRADSYFCPWDKSFRKHHNDRHTFCINGYDKQRQVLMFTDPFYHLEGIRFGCREFSAAFRGLYGCCDLVPYTLPKEGAAGLLYKRVKELIEQGTFEQMQQFADDFIQYADVSAEMEDVYECWKTPLFQNIKGFASSRARLPELISYVLKVSGIKEEKTVLELERIASEWMKLRDNCLKYLISGSPRTKRSFADDMKQMAEQEKKAAQDIISLLSGR